MALISIPDNIQPQKYILSFYRHAKESNTQLTRKTDKHDKCYRREVSKRSSLHERVEITTRFCNKTPKKDRKLVILHAHCEFR